MLYRQRELPNERKRSFCELPLRIAGNERKCSRCKRRTSANYRCIIQQFTNGAPKESLLSEGVIYLLYRQRELPNERKRSFCELPLRIAGNERKCSRCKRRTSANYRCIIQQCVNETSEESLLSEGVFYLLYRQREYRRSVLKFKPKHQNASAVYFRNCSSAKKIL